MSRRLIRRSPDLQRLWEEGYEVEVRAGHLLVKHVPYVTVTRAVARATLVSALDLAGDVTTRPSSHVVKFTGEAPCDESGQPLARIILSSKREDLGGGIVVQHEFSSKPPSGYADYFEKMSTYAEILTGYAQSIEPAVTARTFEVVQDSSEDSVFRYLDTASSRAGIVAITQKLEIPSVAIVGLGGTGSYILDLVAKTPVREIHLFDGDRFGQHNAFRAPGAPSIETLRTAPVKSEYFRTIYSNMRSNIFDHEHLDDDSADMLASVSFAFVAVDDADARKLAVEKLLDADVPFVDVGMGLDTGDAALLGQLRVTAVTAEARDHVDSTIPLKTGPDDDEYASNIQIADLNALNAALAVVRWKKMFGFYSDLEREHSSLYQIDGNHLINEHKR
ncbi:MAG: ThiF family adenylyltransferase [Chloroflexi bacterium]|nr:ThiF family adenylyltransferase [Chloroflexota bacterium]